MESQLFGNLYELPGSASVESKKLKLGGDSDSTEVCDNEELTSVSSTNEDNKEGTKQDVLEPPASPGDL